jgi:hypothetical protein
MKKMYSLTILTFLLSVVVIKAQVGIGTPTPNASAMLDISSTNKGLLVPRIALTGTGDKTTIPSPQTSLLVYNKATAGSGTTAVTPGYYYWNGTAWERLTVASSLSASAWTLSGNKGTNPAVNFIGTTDNKSLLFKVNNVLAGKLSVTDVNTSWGYRALVKNTGFFNTAVGRSALASNTSGSYNTAIGDSALTSNTTGNYNTANGHVALYYNTTGNYNTANGESALYNNTTGIYNTANGYQALSSNTTGSYNTAHGWAALYNNTTGIYNTAIGDSALFSNTTGPLNTASGKYALAANTTGTSNTAYGTKALYFNTTGSNNTALGYSADVTSSDLTNATAIGYNTKVACSNCLVLGSDHVHVGIGTSIPQAELEVNGNVVVQSDLHVNNDAYLQGDLQANGSVNVAGSLIAGKFDVGVITAKLEFSIAGFSTTQRQLTCPTGSILLSGGGGARDYNSTTPNIIVNYSGPDLNDSNTWRILVTNAAVDGRACIVYVKCAERLR